MDKFKKQFMCKKNLQMNLYQYKIKTGEEVDFIKYLNIFFIPKWYKNMVNKRELYYISYILQNSIA